MSTAWTPGACCAARRVDAVDQGMAVRTAHKRRLQHVRKLQVVHKAAKSLQQRQVLDPLDRLSDVSIVSHVPRLMGVAVLRCAGLCPMSGIRENRPELRWKANAGWGDFAGRDGLRWGRQRSRCKRRAQMKIATFNINNVNKRLANLLHWLRTAKPDVVCLQELKASNSSFRRGDRESRIRRRVARTKIMERRRDSCPRRRTRRHADRASRRSRATTQSRYIEAAVNGVIVTSLYAPNGNPSPAQIRI